MRLDWTSEGGFLPVGKFAGWLNMFQFTCPIKTFTIEKGTNPQVNQVILIHRCSARCFEAFRDQTLKTSSGKRWWKMAVSDLVDGQFVRTSSCLVTASSSCLHCHCHYEFHQLFLIMSIFISNSFTICWLLLVTMHVRHHHPKLNR